jgi:hypothetical protein
MRHRLPAIALLACIFAASVAGGAFAQALPESSTQCGATLASWSEQEKWAWGQICAGEVADFNQREKQTRDPHGPEPWPADRIVTAKFIRALFSDEHFRNALPRQGVRLSGVRFAEKLDLDNLVVRVPLIVESSRFEKGISVSDLNSNNRISFQNAEINGDFTGYSATMGRLELPCSNVSGQVWLTLAKIRGYVWIEQTHVSKATIADLIEVDGHVIFQNSTFDDKLQMRYSRISASVYLNESVFDRVDLTGTKISGELQAGNNDADHLIYDCKHGAPQRHPTQWSDAGPKDPGGVPKLVLRNTSVDTWKGWKDGWPSLDLQGFSYTQFRIEGIDSAADFGSWGIGWLALEQSHSFQPYQKYAETIGKLGLASQATDILFAGRERERARARSNAFGQYVEMSVARYLIGYGYGNRYFYALGWAALLIAIGCALIRITRENDPGKHDFPLGILFCVDMLVPFIQFRRRHFDVEFKSLVLRRYFIFHRLAGFILGSFILAGMAGLTK